MVLLGGLEFVAAGYVLNELNKDSKKDVKKRRTDSKDRRDRKDSRKHHHRRDSTSSPHRPRPQQQQNLLPPQMPPPRPMSAPPQMPHPGWQPQPFQGHQQQWHPNPGSNRPVQQPPMPYHPPQPQFQPMPAPRPAMNSVYPPAGTYIDLKTGKVQHNLYPPDHPLHRSVDAERMRGEDGAYPLDKAAARSYSFQPDGAQSDRLMYTPYTMPPPSVPSPRPGYMELDAETPGRFRPYDEKRDRPPFSPPPPYRE